MSPLSKPVRHSVALPLSPAPHKYNTSYTRSKERNSSVTFAEEIGNALIEEYMIDAAQAIDGNENSSLVWSKCCTPGR